MLTRTRRRAAALAAASLLAVVLLALAGAAGAANGSLPGGTSISVDILDPPDGAVVNGPNVPVDGTAAVGQGVPVPNTALVYALDVSGSTDQAGGCGGDQNGDGNADFILDCEIAAAKATNQSAIVNQTVLDTGVVAFASSAVVGDVGPAMGDQALTAPNTNANSANGPDIEEVFSSAFSDFFGGDGGLAQFTLKNAGQFTNFEAAVASATALATSSSAGTKIVAMLSDGIASAGGSVADEVAAAAAAGVRFETFAIGGASDCDNPGLGGQGSLRDIATGTGGTCTEVADLGDLPDIVPGVIASRLTEVAISLDQTINGSSDAPFTALTNADIDPDLPQLGPASVTWETLLMGLSPGLYEVCARATGSDGGGSGSVIECSTFRVNAPPDCSGLEVNPFTLWPPNHKLRLVTVTGASDPDGDDITTQILGVTQDEPVNGQADGNTSPDAVLGPASNQARLRAERSGIGDGRVYRLLVVVTDEFGLRCTGTVRVSVPHDQASPPIDSAPPSFNSLVP